MSIEFATYAGIITTIDLRELETAMRSESLDPAQYDYRDPASGLSFQKIGSNRLFIADPAYPLTAQLLSDEWQISYDATYSGFEHIKFVAKNQDATVSANWKSINDVLASYFYDGQLPIASFQTLFIQIVQLQAPNYLTSTLFTPTQPYARITWTQSSPQNFAMSYMTSTRVPFNTLADENYLAGGLGHILPIVSGH